MPSRSRQPERTSSSTGLHPTDIFLPVFSETNTILFFPHFT
jgi:hypothetical protein